jgi:hypothetical protein
MFVALIKKDIRLLQSFLLVAIVATIGCYVTTGIGVFLLTNYQDESMQTLPVRCFLLLRGGHNFGFGTTALCSVLIAGSIITLERADRSAEFLACLPPSRLQHLASKFSVLFGMTALMIFVHITAAFLSDLLLPYVRATNYPFAGGTQMSTVLRFVAVVLSMIGGALAVSAWQNSNGVSVLCGLLTPLGIIALLQLITYWLDIPMSNSNEFMNRFSMFASLTGCSLILCGAYWYIERTEP